ncbi:alpha/beta fold hydrolase [Ottowia thiooxydans]|uniref:alpha/beta fold hydrolase n=1 Tax=Ottowia thiooxydans TaxID=219182 RepID=UPI000490C5F8|nr:alpha/beta fold hydrolase [Ottowia thiooxydans]
MTAATPRPQVVLLGGHLCTPVLWEHQCAALAAVADCLPLALEGGGSMEELAKTVLEKASPQFSLVGLSMGGHVAMEIMRRAPERVERLALLDTRADIDSPERMAVRAQDDAIVRDQGFEALARTLPDRWMSARCAAMPELRATVLRMVRSVGEQSRQQQLRALLSRVDSRPSLSSIRCPTLVMCGRQDAPNPVWMHEEMAALIPGATLRIIEECGHLSPLEQPQEVSRALGDWLGW